jgi:hypothetical protein
MPRHQAQKWTAAGPVQEKTESNSSESSEINIV